MSRATRWFLAAALTLTLAGSPAFASDAGDAYKAAKVKKDAVRKAGKDETKRAEAQKEFEGFCKDKVAVLGGARAGMSRVDLMYLGWLQLWAGDKEAGIATVREAVTSKKETQYASAIHANLISILIEADQPDGAAAEVQKMMEEYPGGKDTKVSAMNLGMAYREVMEFDKSAKWLQIAFDMGSVDAIKPLVNDLLMAGRRDEAVKTAKGAIDTVAPQMKDDMKILADITAKVGSDVSDLLKFDAFLPAASGEPEMKGKVVVLGFWNVSARTFKWTLNLLDSVKKRYGDDVTCLATTTYYKKNPDSGKIEDEMTPETERGWAEKLVYGQEEWRGRVAYLPNETATAALGVSALPHFVVVGKDGTLLFAHTMNVLDGTDVKILQKVIEQATGR